MSRGELTFEADGRDVGRIIGTKGCHIRALEQGSGCRIKTPAKDSDDTTVRITGGTEAERKRCKDAIDGVLMGDEPINVFAEMDGAAVLKNLDPTVLSHVGRKQREFEDKFRVVLELHSRSVHIWPAGNRGGKKRSSGDDEKNRDIVSKAKEGIQDDIDDLQTGDTLVVRVPAAIVNSVINDSCLRQLQDSSGMTASVTKDDQGTGIRLVGLRGALMEAKSTIEKLVQGEGADFLSIFPGMLDTMSNRAWDDLTRVSAHTYAG